MPILAILRRRPQHTLKLALGTRGGQFLFKPGGWVNHGAPILRSDLQGGKTGARKMEVCLSRPPN